MRLHIKIDCTMEVQNALIRIATSDCKNLDQKSSKTITTRFLKDKIYRLIGIRVQGVLYKSNELIIQVDSKEKFLLFKKNAGRVTSYLTGITKNIVNKSA